MTRTASRTCGSGTRRLAEGSAGRSSPQGREAARSTCGTCWCSAPACPAKRLAARTWPSRPRRSSTPRPTTIACRTDRRQFDAGVEIEDVRTDRVGITRPQGAGYDVGAFERQAVTLRGDQRTTGGTGERRNGGCRAAMESAYDGRTEGQGPSTSSDRGADTGRAAGRRPACEWVPGRAGKPRRSLCGLPARPGTHSTARTRGPDPAA